MALMRWACWHSDVAMSCTGSGRSGMAASISARPYTAASGVRRSCDSADSSELRSRSDSMPTMAPCATST